jgi:GNAT superfamily N-acetyltransferase
MTEPEQEGDFDDERVRIRAAHTALVADGTLEPLSPDDAETRLWLDCELCSLVENRFFVSLDPLALTPALRDEWERKAASDEPLSSPHGHTWYRFTYWIRENGQRVGTIGLATFYMGIGLVTVSSLYVLPSHRRTGIAARALRRAQAAVRAHGGRGLRIPTYWTWQAAVRFYLGLGLWISNWKHSLVFNWREDLPAHRVEIGAEEASFGVVRGGGVEWLIRARRDGDRLVWTELPALSEPGVKSALWFAATQTFALALATHGFPLIRSAEQWASRRDWSDCGEPEGLAGKIEVFEAVDREAGYEIRTPRIAGVPYRGLAAIDD